MSSPRRKDPDYTLNIFHHTDEETNVRGILFLVQTTKIFVSFRYEILLQDEVSPGVIRLRILGLHTPELLMPQTGPARGSRFYPGLEGRFRVQVTKHDKAAAEFDLHAGADLLHIHAAPKNSFILVSNEPVFVE